MPFLIAGAMLVMAFGLYGLSRDRRQLPGLAPWGLGCALFGMSALTLAIPGYAPTATAPMLVWVTWLIGISLLMAAAYAFWLSVRMLLGRSISPTWLVAALAANVVLVAGTAWQPVFMPWSLAASTTLLGLLFGAAAWTGYRTRHDTAAAPPPRWIARSLMVCAVIWIGQALALLPQEQPRWYTWVLPLEFVLLLAATVMLMLVAQHRVAGLLDRYVDVDMMTEVLNRRGFQRVIQFTAGRLRRSRGALSFVVCEIDELAPFAQRHGMVMRDRLLRAFARLLQRAVRDSDFIARLESDVFCILLPDTGLDGAALVADRLHSFIAARKLDTGPANAAVTASFGVASGVIGEQDIEALQEAAFQALGMARGNGGNQVSGAERITLETSRLIPL